MKNKKHNTLLLICTVCGVGFIFILFSLSEYGLHRDNSFIRQFPGHPAIKTNELDLSYNSYYIAGAAEGHIYLGNTTTPLNVMILDTTLQKIQYKKLSLDQDSIPNQAPQLRVLPPYFFLIDGTIPYIFRGNTKDWKAYSILKDSYYFDHITPRDSITLFIRTRSDSTNEHILGKINLSNHTKIDLTDKLLQKQIDGIFDTDGVLQYNEQLHQIIYTYYYRNQYIVANDFLQLKLLGKTIDTVSRAQLKIATIASKNQRKLASPALIVNKNSATYGNYLFINSALPGRNEPLEMWKEASIIDVYNIVKNTYEFSLYVYDIKKEKLKSFQILDDKLIGLIGNHIVIYQLHKNRFKDMYMKHRTTIVTPKNNYYGLYANNTAVRGKTENLKKRVGH